MYFIEKFQLKKYYKTIFMLFFLMHSFLNSSLVIFYDSKKYEQLGSNEINLSYQVMTALLQGVSVLASTSLFKNIIERKKKFINQLQNKNSIEAELFNLYEIVNSEIKIASLSSINQMMDLYWFEKNFSRLTKLNAEEFKNIYFNMFCYLFDFEKIDATFADLDNFIFVKQNIDFKKFKAKEFKKFDIKNLEFYKTINKENKFNLTAILEEICVKNLAYTFYLSGHGTYKDKKSLISGMQINEFTTFLKFLNTGVKTNLLVYNSCYGGGMNLILPFFEKDKDLIFNYPIILLALTAAPTYAFGFFSALKLPPYDATTYLESTDIKNEKLQFYFFQDFNKFFNLAEKKFFNTKLVQEVNKYVTCKYENCELNKIENLPLIRAVGEKQFLPLENKFSFSLTNINDNKNINLKNKMALLFFIKYFKGKLTLISEEIPLFISMLPKINMHKINFFDTNGLKLTKFIKGAFLNIDDYKEYKIFNFQNLKIYDDIFGENKEITLKNILFILNPKNIEALKNYNLSAIKLLVLNKNLKNNNAVIFFKDTALNKDLVLNYKIISLSLN